MNKKIIELKTKPEVVFFEECFVCQSLDPVIYIENIDENVDRKLILDKYKALLEKLKTKFDIKYEEEKLESIDSAQDIDDLSYYFQVFVKPDVEIDLEYELEEEEIQEYLQNVKELLLNIEEFIKKEFTEFEVDLIYNYFNELEWLVDTELEECDEEELEDDYYGCKNAEIIKENLNNLL